MWTAPAAIVVGLVVGVLLSVVVAGIGAAAGSSSTTPAVTLISDVVFDLGFVVTALYFASANGRRPRPADFGYRRIALSVGVGAFLIAGLGYFIVTAIYQAIVKLHGTDKLPTDLGISTSTAALVGAAIFVCVIAPICEEFFFRGFIFGALRRWHIMVRGHNIGTWVAAVETGILFGIAHTGSASPAVPAPARLPRLRPLHRPLEDPLPVPLHGAPLGQQLDRARLQRTALERRRDHRPAGGLAGGDRGHHAAAVEPLAGAGDLSLAPRRTRRTPRTWVIARHFDSPSPPGG